MCTPGGDILPKSTTRHYVTKNEKSHRRNFYIHFRVLFKGYNKVFGEKIISCTFFRQNSYTFSARGQFLEKK